MSIRRFATLVAFLLGFALLTGCGNSSSTTGEVSEKAKMKEKMTPGGPGGGSKAK